MKTLEERTVTHIEKMREQIRIMSASIYDLNRQIVELEEAVDQSVRKSLEALARINRV